MYFNIGIELIIQKQLTIVSKIMYVKDTLNELILPARLYDGVVDAVVNVDVDVVNVIVDVDVIVDIVDVIVDVVDVVVDTAVVYTSQSLLGLQPKGTLMPA